MKMKKLVAMLMVVLLVAGVVSGCGSSQKASESQDQKPELVELNYYSHPDEKGVMSKMIEKFQEDNPNIKVNLVELPADTNKKLTMISTALQAEDSSMDVFDADVIWPAIFASAGWAEPLDGYMTEEDRDQFLPGAVFANEYMGKYYGIPYRTDAGMLYYRKDLLEKHGRAVPETWEDLVETAQYIMGKEESITSGHAGSWKQYEGLTCNLTEFVWSFGGDFLDNKGNVIFDSKESVSAMETMSGMINQDKITPEGVITFGSGDARAVFFAGNMVFLRDWPSGWSKSQDEENSKIVGKVGIAPLPKGSMENESYSTLGGWQVMVSKFSEHKEEAVKFAIFRASEYSQILAAEELSHIPSRKALYENEEVLASMPFLKDMYPAIIHAYPRPKSPYYAELSNILQIETQRAFIQEKTPEEAVMDAAKQMREVLGQ